MLYIFPKKASYKIIVHYHKQNIDTGRVKTQDIPMTTKISPAVFYSYTHLPPTPTPAS